MSVYEFYNPFTKINKKNDSVTTQHYQFNPHFKSEEKHFNYGCGNKKDDKKDKDCNCPSKPPPFCPPSPVNCWQNCPPQFFMPPPICPTQTPHDCNQFSWLKCCCDWQPYILLPYNQFLCCPPHQDCCDKKPDCNNNFKYAFVYFNCGKKE